MKNVIRYIKSGYDKLINNKIFKIMLNIFFILCVSIFIFFIIKNGKQDFFSTHNKKVFYIVTGTVSLTITLITYIIIRFVLLNNKMEFYKKYFIAALYIGCFSLFLTPFGNGADEISHFCRVYEISRGDLITPLDGVNSVPNSFREYINKYGEKGNFSYSDFKTYMFSKLNPKDVVEKKFFWANTTLYSPIQYLPQAAGVFIGRILNLPIGIVGYLGRIFGFAAWLFITTYAIKVVPNKKTFFSIVMLLPIGIRICCMFIRRYNFKCYCFIIYLLYI